MIKFKSGDIIHNGFYQYLILGVTTCQRRYIYKVHKKRKTEGTIYAPNQKPTLMTVQGEWVDAVDVAQEIVTCNTYDIDQMFVRLSCDYSLVPSYAGEEYSNKPWEIGPGTFIRGLIFIKKDKGYFVFSLMKDEKKIIRVRLPYDCIERKIMNKEETYEIKPEAKESLKWCIGRTLESYAEELLFGLTEKQKNKAIEIADKKEKKHWEKRHKETLKEKAKKS